MTAFFLAIVPGSCGSGEGEGGEQSNVNSSEANILDKNDQANPTVVTLIEENGLEEQKIENKQQEIDCEHWYGGVGYIHGFDDTVQSVAKGYEAERKGLKVGDRVVGVQSENGQIKGEPGTKIVLVIERDGSIIYISMTRERVCYD